jgi:hypothetical protein
MSAGEKKKHADGGPLRACDTTPFVWRAWSNARAWKARARKVGLQGEGKIVEVDLDRLRFPVEIKTREAARPPGPVVYFIQAEGGGPIKIGVTTGSAETRLASLQTGSPVKLRIVTTTPGDPALERKLHHRFAAHRLHGEWFSPAPELLAFIAGGCR